MKDEITCAGWQQYLSQSVGVAIWVRIDEQRLDLYCAGVLEKQYSVSTASRGMGNEPDSYCTPSGLHQICDRFGDGEPVGRVFRHRCATRQIAQIETRAVPTGQDLITTRILWLAGAEKANTGRCSTKERYIYIHGTPEEGLIGQPVSHGCIRMRNADILELYPEIAVGTPVYVSLDGG
ncbi:MAG: L,D-transpeptidase family protein [Gammaproteobacteria bacterium]